VVAWAQRDGLAYLAAQRGHFTVTVDRYAAATAGRTMTAGSPSGILAPVVSARWM